MRVEMENPLQSKDAGHVPAGKEPDRRRPGD
jgi:hypothetical protein